MRRMRRFATVAIAIAALGSQPATPVAHADDRVEAGWRWFLQAEFDRALEAFDEAAARSLDREEAARLLEGRVQVHWAMGDENRAAEDLARLAVLDPAHELARESPPDLLAAFERARTRARGAPRIRVRVVEQDGVARVTADVENDPSGLVLSVRIRARARGGEWIEVTDAPLELDAPTGARIEH